MWQANGYTFLHSGRPLPCAEETAVRNEGVGIMLDERASAAWREAEEAWEAISSRVVTARLKAMGRGQRRPGGARTTRNSFISVISAYAPTARAPPEIKSKFMEELQDVLDKVPSSDLLLLLGDFNARVGCSDTNGELWRGIWGRYGIGAGNEAGDRLLEFCAVNQLTVMNTWFAKKDIHLATWQHPATRQQYMIDYVLMRAGERTVCTDVQVM